MLGKCLGAQDERDAQAGDGSRQHRAAKAAQEDARTSYAVSNGGIAEGELGLFTPDKFGRNK
jgi:hypothetical protein